MRIIVTLVGGLLLVLISAQTPAADKQTVVVDEWWNVDYAKEGCKLPLRFAGKPEAESEKICKNVPAVAAVIDFEDRLLTQFAALDSCQHVAVLRMNDAETSRAIKHPYWQLMLDQNGQNGAPDWTIVNGPTLFKGEGSPEKVAHDICHILKDHRAA
jgi:hypothetical protein